MSSHNYQDNSENLDELNEKLKEAKRAKQQAEKEARKQRQKEAAKEGLEEWLKGEELYFVAKLNRYAWKDNGIWYLLLAEALPRMFPALTDKVTKEQLPIVMDDLNRVYADCTVTFHPENYPNQLNMMDRTDWLAPLEGKHHWLFDVLIRSLGCNKPENMEHIQHVLAYKYEHPDCWLLPCLSFYGEGRVGKGVLVGTVWRRIFRNRTVVATQKFLMSDFNAKLKGAMIAAIDESVVGKTDRDNLYSTVGNERILINDKNEKHYEVDNTALYMIFSNNWNGGSLLDRGASDERMSVMCLEAGKTLKYWLAQQMGVNEDEAHEWLVTEGKRIVEDETEIRKWLHHLLTNYGGRKMPKALHGADYRSLMKIQEKIDEKIAHAVFSQDDFDYISVVDLHKGYQTLQSERNSAAKAMGMSIFNRLVQVWCDRHMPHIQKVEHTFYVDMEVDHAELMQSIRNHQPKPKAKQKQKRKTVWLDTRKHEVSHINFEPENTDKYLDTIGYRTIWVGPEVI